MPILMHVQTRGKIQIVAMVALQPLGQFRTARGARPIDLRAIAGRQNHHLGDAALLPSVCSAATRRSSLNATFSRKATGAVL